MLMAISQGLLIALGAIYIASRFMEYNATHS